MVVVHQEVGRASDYASQRLLDQADPVILDDVDGPALPA
jgi:hypothetical protein